MRNNEKPHICSECGGKCCQRMPGCAVPDDFDSLIQNMREAIESGKWSIDWYDADPCIYYMRPRMNGCGVVHPAYPGDGVCIFLTKSGCELSFKDRPQGCKDLVAGDDGNCPQVHGKLYYARKWNDYQQFLYDIMYDLDE